MNYCINAAWHGDDQSVSLLRCNEAQVALIAVFRSSALLGLVSLIIESLWASGHCIVGSGVSHLDSMGFRSLHCWVWCLSSRFYGVQVIALLGLVSLI